MLRRKDIYILIAGEESQAICLAFRAQGYAAFSCDLKACSGGHPEYHLQMDMFDALKLHNWHLVIFHPVCKYVAGSGLHWNGRILGRAEKTEKALRFICRCFNSGVFHLGLENPVGCISTRIYKDTDGIYKVAAIGEKHTYFKPAQTIQPYMYGENASKATCFWLLNLPKLKGTKRFQGRLVNGRERWSNQTDSGQNKLGPSDDRDELRSKTYPGIAAAIADQWGRYVLAYNQIKDLL